MPLALLCLLCYIYKWRQNQSADIPYTVLQHYFLKNDVRQSPPRFITDREIFEQYFGCAAVMGPDGQPTPIDFDTHYVIAVTRPTTELATELFPVSLRQDDSSTVVFTYQVKIGEKRSYTTTPILLIMVDKSYYGKIRLQEL